MIRKGITLTFCDVAESHYGMEQIGSKEEFGFDETDILKLASKFPDKSEVYDLTGLMPIWNTQRPCTLILVIRDPFPQLKDKLFNILSNDNESFDINGNLIGVTWDKQKFMYERVVNSHARYNLCFSNYDKLFQNIPYKREACIEEKRGTIYNMKSIPVLSFLHQEIMKNVECGLQCEANYYFDLETTYIGFHSDKERVKIIGYRLGDSFPLHFRWHEDSKVVSPLATCLLNHGDMYMMTDYARGKKIKGTNILLKHAAGTNPIIFKEK